MTSRCLVLLALAIGCDSPSSTDRAHENMTGSAQTTCLHEQGKYSDLTFCVDGRVLLICNPERCLSVPLDAVKQ